MTARFLSGALALPFFCSCASSSGDATGTGGNGGSPGQSVCDIGPATETYAVGLSAKSADGKLKITFMDANPAPPAKGLNTWSIQVTDAMNEPVTGATITLKPFMPEHGHGSSIVPQITPMSAPGTYQVTLIDLFMPGVWTNTFTVMPTSGPVETAVFAFCIED